MCGVCRSDFVGVSVACGNWMSDGSLNDWGWRKKLIRLKLLLLDVQV